MIRSDPGRNYVLNSYTEDELREEPAIGLHADIGWSGVRI